MQRLTLILLAILAVLQWTLWRGKNGISDYIELKQYVELQQAANGELERRNGQMYAEITDLNSGSDAVEERARNELGLIKQGETFIRVIDQEH
uniref:cell division protein FtsB n=1 Tax=Thaumasiovibrio occultus TaxID=1891184 RepID=UPI000B35B8BD|nr:cell division protein FtsB [Thaumasiovibrio occultus]